MTQNPQCSQNKVSKCSECGFDGVIYRDGKIYCMACLHLRIDLQ